MSVLIYDPTNQAYKDTGGNKVYSSNDSAFVDAGGKVKVGDEWVDVFDNSELQDSLYPMTSSSDFANFIPISGSDYAHATMTANSDGTELKKNANLSTIAAYEVPTDISNVGTGDFELAFETKIENPSNALFFHYLVICDGTNPDIVNNHFCLLENGDGWSDTYEGEFIDLSYNSLNDYKREIYKSGYGDWFTLKAVRKNGVITMTSKRNDSIFSTLVVNDGTDISNKKVVLGWNGLNNYNQGANRVRNIYFGEPRD